MMTFYQQYQCMLMKKAGEKQSMLPAIPVSKMQQKPIKDILKQLKERKMVIQSRIKTQIQESQTDQKDENQFQLRERVITEVPYYINRNTYYKRVPGMDSLDRVTFESKIKQKQQQQQSGRDSQLQSQTRKRHSLLQPIVDQQVKNETSPKSKKLMLKQIEQLFVQIPVDPRERTEASIQQLKEFLVQNNIFFAKIHHVIAICFLKLNRLMWLQKHQILYKKGQERNAFYIILCGRLKIYDGEKNLKKICSPGQSVGEEQLFSTKIHKITKQSAKAISRCFLVEIRTQNYKKMAEEMVRYGYRVIFNEAESIIKRNYITKNWLRGEKDRYEKKY